MTEDSGRVVARGYDLIADAYLERFGTSAVRQRWLDRLVARLPCGRARVLDLGCGAGIPVSRDLAALGHDVVGIDISGEQMRRARQNVPDATFIAADMCAAMFDPEHFDAVGVFYAITHLPPASQRLLLRKIGNWLKPGGVMIGSFGTGAVGDWFGEWMGTKMYFGHTSEDELSISLADAGLWTRHSLVEMQDDESASFLWVEAVKDR